jgi:hypothetical protein
MIGKNVMTALILAMAWAAPAAAHSFNVALVFAGDAAPADARGEILNGFLVAAAERDGHPDETADGHLGGLDVFVLTDTLAEADVVAVFGGGAPPASGDLARAVLLPPAEDVPAVDGDEAAAFAAAYLAAHGVRPGPWAAEGYHAARRIDAAVRAQGGVDDAEALRRSFEATAKGFAW